MRVRLPFVPPVSGRRLLMGSLLAVAAVAGAWVVTRPLGDPWVPLGTGPNFYPIGEERPGVLVGQRAPELAGATGLNGASSSLADYAGRPRWIVFWTTWCAPCRQEIPDLVAEYELHTDDGLALLAVNRGEAADQVRSYADARNLPYTILLDPDLAADAAYGVWGLPTHYFVDAGGVIRARYFGPLSRSGIERLLATILGS